MAVKIPGKAPVERLELSARDSAAFTEALLNPPPPGERLRRAAKRYKKATG